METCRWSKAEIEHANRTTKQTWIERAREALQTACIEIEKCAWNPGVLAECVSSWHSIAEVVEQREEERMLVLEPWEHVLMMIQHADIQSRKIENQISEMNSKIDNEEENIQKRKKEAEETLAVVQHNAMEIIHALEALSIYRSGIFYIKEYLEIDKKIPLFKGKIIGILKKMQNLYEEDTRILSKKIAETDR